MGTRPPEDLAAFYADQYDQVVGTLVLFTGDRPLAEELAQEAFVKACQHWERVRQMASPGAWTHRVAINLAISSRRRRQVERRAQHRLAARRPAGASDADGGGGDLHRALQALPEAERTVVLLRFWVDLSVAQVASTLGLPEGTVKTRTRSGLASLRALGLAPSGDREAGGEPGAPAIERGGASR